MQKYIVENFLHTHCLLPGLSLIFANVTLGNVRNIFNALSLILLAIFTYYFVLKYVKVEVMVV